MKHRMRQTSIDAYLKLKHLRTKQQLVYQVIKRHPACDLDIANELQQPINRITPRRSELIELGLIEEAYKAVNGQTNRTVTYWRAK